MRPTGLLRGKWVIPPAIVLTLIALGIWTIRPWPFGDWLGASGLPSSSPWVMVKGWCSGGVAPLTPFGLLYLFEVADLLTLAALLIALVSLVSLRMVVWRDRGSGTHPSMQEPVPRLPRIRLRVRTLLILIALVGLELGWEIVAWRNWRLGVRHGLAARRYAELEASHQSVLSHDEAWLSTLDQSVSERTKSWTPAARAAQMAYERDRASDSASFNARLAAYYRELRQEYERAAANPSQALAPDPPQPEPPARDLWYYQHDPAGALVLCESLIRRYPDLVWAHKHRAWILATCPDPELRDGKLAVAAATRAAELANWKEEGAVIIGAEGLFTTLAAAYAEAGDFDSAVRWEQRHLDEERRRSQEFDEQVRSSGGVPPPCPMPDLSRLNRYKAGKPYRMPR